MYFSKACKVYVKVQSVWGQILFLEMLWLMRVGKFNVTTLFLNRWLLEPLNPGGTMVAGTEKVEVKVAAVKKFLWGIPAVRAFSGER